MYPLSLHSSVISLNQLMIQNQNVKSMIVWNMIYHSRKENVGHGIRGAVLYSHKECFVLSFSNLNLHNIARFDRIMFTKNPRIDTQCINSVTVDTINAELSVFIP